MKKAYSVISSIALIFLMASFCMADDRTIMVGTNHAVEGIHGSACSDPEAEPPVECDYSTLNAAIYTERANDPGAYHLIFECYKFVDQSTGVSVEDTTAVTTLAAMAADDGVDEHVIIKGYSGEIDSGNSGIWSDERYRLHVTTTTGNAINIALDFIEVQDLQVKMTRTSGTNPASVASIIHMGSPETSLGTTFERNIFILELESDDTNDNCDIIKCTDGDATVYVRNSLLLSDGGGTHPARAGIYGVHRGGHSNLTIAGDLDYGFYSIGTSYYLDTVTNIICDDSLTNCFHTQSCTMWPYDHVVTGSSDDPECSGDDISECTVTFEDESNDDYHLDSNDTCAKGSGDNLTSDFTDDIDKDTRHSSDPWDMGMDEI